MTQWMLRFGSKTAETSDPGDKNKRWGYEVKEEEEEEEEGRRRRRRRKMKEGGEGEETKKKEKPSPRGWPKSTLASEPVPPVGGKTKQFLCLETALASLGALRAFLIICLLILCMLLEGGGGGGGGGKGGSESGSAVVEFFSQLRHMALASQRTWSGTVFPGRLSNVTAPRLSIASQT